MRIVLVQVMCLPKARNQILFLLWGKGEEARGAFHRVELVSELIDAKFSLITTQRFQKTMRRARLSIPLPCYLKRSALRSSLPATMPISSASVYMPGNGEHDGQMRLTASSNGNG